MSYNLIDDDFLKEEGKIFRDTLRAFAKKEITFEKCRKMEEEHKISVDLIRGLGGIGVFGAQFPQKYGGVVEGEKLGNRVFGTLIQEELAYYEPGIAICCGSLFAAHCILIGGNEKQKELYLPGMTKGEITGAFALSEPNCGSDAGALESKVENNLLNGTKQFITSGSFADIVIWFAKNGANKGEIGAYILGKDSGYTIRVDNNVGQRTTGTSQLNAQDVLIPENSLLNGSYKNGKTYEHHGFALALKILDDGRLRIAGNTLGIMKRAIDESVNYAKERKTFGQQIKDYQMIQEKIANMKMNYEHVRQFTYTVAHEADKNGFVDTTKASMAKTFATEKMQKVVYDAVQIHGGIGVSNEHIMGKLDRDARAYTIFEGTSEINRLIIAKNALKD